MYINVKVFIKSLRSNYTKFLDSAKDGEVVTPEVLEALLTASLVKTCQECMKDGYLVDDTLVYGVESWTNESRKSVH